ncbi:DUF2178 domain-containing protein [Gracilibacillus sp. S3-1-1]|uniref:DUF2178 domain-containing protein n=1 Tax=Gracilibacillus pellucidus TaxID=3095368 RepID=A0ACC6M320_9BACI|nr:DUF2178 domain-containing protein [Gracilibacillus sp. S3-1-1]MDX8045343.1 DUF2178 domain-containing protein [Gracilibacillus sp. S3-1-1]
MYKTWAEESQGNWNILLGSGFVLLIVGMVLILVFTKKMGKGDERTNYINLKSSLFMLCGIVLCDLIFPKDYMWQIFFLFKYGLGFTASGIYLAIKYKIDFS